MLINFKISFIDALRKFLTERSIRHANINDGPKNMDSCTEMMDPKNG